MLKILFSLFVLFALYVEAYNYSDFTHGYEKLPNTPARKDVFLDILLPKIQAENRKILEDRAFVLNFLDTYLITYNANDRDSIYRLAKLAKRYKIKHIYDKTAYENKVNAIPTSMVLAQAAVESAWGTSRFVKLANNIFGVWTWGKEGIVPEHREEGKNHKIKIYKSLEESIRAYMLNLNRNPAYKKFRSKRLRFAQEEKSYKGTDSAETMTNYSGIGHRYNEILKSTIIKNDWLKYDPHVVKKSRHTVKWW